jgi:hypothetical protein
MTATKRLRVATPDGPTFLLAAHSGEVADKDEMPAEIG